MKIVNDAMSSAYIIYEVAQGEEIRSLRWDSRYASLLDHLPTGNVRAKERLLLTATMPVPEKVMCVRLARDDVPGKSVRLWGYSGPGRKTQAKIYRPLLTASGRETDAHCLVEVGYAPVYEGEVVIPRTADPECTEAWIVDSDALSLMGMKDALKL